MSRPQATSSGKDRESARGSRDPRPDRAPSGTKARRKSGVADPNRSGRNWWYGSGLDGRREQAACRAALAVSNPQVPAVLKQVSSWLEDPDADLDVLETNLTQLFDTEDKEEHGKKLKHRKRHRRRVRAADQAAAVKPRLSRKRMRNWTLRFLLRSTLKKRKAWRRSFMPKPKRQMPQTPPMPWRSTNLGGLLGSFAGISGAATRGAGSRFTLSSSLVRFAARSVIGSNASRQNGSSMARSAERYQQARR